MVGQLESFHAPPPATASPAAWRTALRRLNGVPAAKLRTSTFGTRVGQWGAVAARALSSGSAIESGTAFRSAAK